MDTVGALLLGAIADGCPQADESGLGLLLASLGDRFVDGLQVTEETMRLWTAQRDARYLPVTIIDVKNLPAVRKIPLLDVLGECDSGVTVDGDICRPNQSL